MLRKTIFVWLSLVSVFFSYGVDTLFDTTATAQEKKISQAQKGKPKKKVRSIKKARKAKKTPPAWGFPFAVDPGTYGNTVISRNLPGSPLASVFKSVVFPHWWHRMQFTCKVCHSDIGFTMKAGADDMKMPEIQQGKWCGQCHNGKIAFSPVFCPRCHSKGMAIKENRNPREHLSKLPKAPFGNRVDWVKALNEGAVWPKADKEGKAEMMVFDRDIEFKVQPIQGALAPLPNVIFPHKQHTQWLFCNNCHPQIFKMKAGANPVTMYDIFEGYYCGACHGKVAFPLTSCSRCHNRERLKASYKKPLPPANRGL